MKLAVIKAVLILARLVFSPLLREGATTKNQGQAGSPCVHGVGGALHCNRLLSELGIYGQFPYVLRCRMACGRLRAVILPVCIVA